MDIRYRHEWKHVISYADMLEIRMRMMAVARPDPHAHDGRYQIRSLYFDDLSDKALREKIDGVNQCQMNEKAGMTFAAALRSILRQDPDIVMVGEIRDGETADIAIRAAITGHLVLSTLHTNDAASTVTRLVDMGVEAYMVATSLIGIVAQRLTKTLCPECKKPRMSTPEEEKLMGIDHSVMIYDAGGCPKCKNTGYNGRTAIHEILLAEL